MSFTLSDIYTTHPDIAYISKNGSVKIIFLDESVNELIELHGPAAKCFTFFDKNTAPLEEIKNRLGENVSAQTFDQDFEKLINFFITKSLIKKFNARA